MLTQECIGCVEIRDGCCKAEKDIAPHDGDPKGNSTEKMEIVDHSGERNWEKILLGLGMEMGDVHEG